jgi:hypothetical protein
MSDLSDTSLDISQYFPYFPFPASVFSYIFVFAQVFAKIFVTFRKLFLRKAKINFRENTKTKIFVSTLDLDWKNFSLIQRVKKHRIPDPQHGEQDTGTVN